MWSELPFDVLSNIFSFLPPDSLARANLACRNWRTCATSYPLTSASVRRHRRPPWFIALPARGRGISCCYLLNPCTRNWHSLSLDFLPETLRPAATVAGGGLLLLRPTGSVGFHLSVCNPFTRQFRYLPPLNRARANPALAVVEPGSDSGRFSVYVAGGMSGGGRGSYEPTLEVYESWTDSWRVLGSMPVEFAVRLAVWAPNDAAVHVGGSLYWVTSARAYSVMGYEIESDSWRELSVPFANRLEFAGLVRVDGRLVLVGAMGGDGAALACVWRLEEGDVWVLTAEVPPELGMRLSSWGSTKCAGIDGAVCLYREIGSGMVVWREVGEEKRKRWEWDWVEGCFSVPAKQVLNFPVRGVLLHPNLSPFMLPLKEGYATVLSFFLFFAKQFFHFFSVLNLSRFIVFVLTFVF